MSEIILAGPCAELHAGVESLAVTSFHTLQINNVAVEIFRHLMLIESDSGYYIVFRSGHTFSRHADKPVRFLVQTDERLLPSVLTRNETASMAGFG